jgi:hypothetical protein
MSIYYSPSAGAFYDERLHGFRRIQVVDEERLAALQAECLEEGEESDACAQLSLDPPTMTVDNPDCRIPADALSISAEEHAAMMAELAEGKVPALERGKVVAVDRERPVEELLAEVRLRRDQALAASDYTQLPDALTAAKRKLWAEHRQALRELPAAVEKAVRAGKAPDSVPFPEPPAV